MKVICLLYPNNIKKEKPKYINYKNRGMDLENLINEANKYYLDNNIAVIYKKPTPVKIIKVTYEKNKSHVDGYLEQKSSLDYVGVYKGKYLDFDAKKTENKDSFPLSNIHAHQLVHIERVIENKGISFLIIEINNLCYLLEGEKIINFIKNNNRKSIPYKYIEENGYIIKYSYNPVLNYLEIIDKCIIKENEYEKDKN